MNDTTALRVICLDCAEEFDITGKEVLSECPHCQSTRVIAEQ